MPFVATEILSGILRLLTAKRKRLIASISRASTTIAPSLHPVVQLLATLEIVALSYAFSYSFVHFSRLLSPNL